MGGQNSPNPFIEILKAMYGQMYGALLYVIRVFSSTEMEK